MEIKTTRFELNGIKYARNEDTGYCIKSDGNKHTRIGAAEFNEAYQSHLDAEDAAIRESVERVMQEEEDAEIARIRQEMSSPECKKSTKKTPRTRRVQVGGMEFAEDGVSVIITPKQVEFIRLLPGTQFWESGVDSALWIDCLCDDLEGKMAPMTIGAMVSTLREKGLLLVGKDKRNHKERKAAFFEFSELGKKVASKVLGL